MATLTAVPERAGTAAPLAAPSMSDMHLFVAVAREASFSRAGAVLGMPHSTVSRRISTLERKLGLRLLNRTTRSVGLTHEGREYFDRAAHLVDQAYSLHEEFSHRGGRLSGPLRISITECIIMHSASRWIAEFHHLYPDVRISIDTAPERTDLARDSIDLCITLSDPSDASLIRHSIATFSRGLYASPDYLARHGVPEDPADLARHDCICTGSKPGGSSQWLLSRGSQRRTVEVSGPVSAVNDVLAPELARHGLGIGAGVREPLEDDVKAGRLVPVLPAWEADPVVVSVLRPNRIVSARARALITFLTDKFRSIAIDYAG